MKKVSFGFILLQIGLILAVAALIGVAFAVTGGDFLVGFVVFAFIIGMLYLISTAYKNILAEILVKRTIKNNEKENHFENTSTFISKKGTLKVDVKTGRVAYISNMNPMQFQVVSAKDIENIKSDYVKAPGGTTYVYFSFSYQKKTFKIPTFSSSQRIYSLNSNKVLEAMSKADSFVEQLKAAKNAAV